MLFTESQLRECRLQATDGEIGKVHELYFDDHQWVVRYIVVDTGNWLNGRRVLLIPDVAGEPDFRSRHLPIHLTRQKIEKSPLASYDQTIDGAHEQSLAMYYDWPYWGSAFIPAPLYPEIGLPAVMQIEAPGSVAVEELEAEADDSKAAVKKQTCEKNPDQVKLRSTIAVRNYRITAEDAHFGHVDDFVIEHPGWEIRYLVVDTHRWFKRILISPAWITSVNWHDHHVHVKLPHELVLKAPEYRPDRPIERKDEIELFDYYAQPQYWQ